MLQQFLKADASASKSTVLQPLIWLEATLLSALLLSLTHGPVWVQVGLGVLSTLGVITFLVFYCYFALTDKDALRTERYALSKMAMERNLLGDNNVGLAEFPVDLVADQQSVPLLPGERR